MIVRIWVIVIIECKMELREYEYVVECIVWVFEFVQLIINEVISVDVSC